MRKPAAALASVCVAYRYAAPPARIFDAWLTPALAGLWLFATASRPMKSVIIDAHDGGTFCYVERRAGATIEHRGEYLEISRPHRLAFTLYSPDFSSVPSCVIATIAPAGPGCELKLVHDRLPADCLAQAEARWTGMFYGLDVILTRFCTEDIH